MTQITVSENSDRMTVGIYAEGHARYAEAGRDIVCASVSILLQTFAQISLALRESGARVVCEVEEGRVRVEIKVISPELFKYASCALQVVEVGCELLARQYPNHVKVTADRTSCGEDLSEVI